MSSKGKVLNSKEGYNLYSSTYEKNTAYLNSFEKNIVLEFMGNLTGKKALDLGCGTGRLVKDLINSGAEVVGIDISDEMIKIMKNKFPKVKSLVADSENLLFDDSSFDFVIASFFIVHLKNLTKTFDEIYRVLKDGGKFVLTNINQRKAPKLDLGSGKKIVIQSYYHRPEDVIKALENSFFKIEKEEFVKDGKVWINQIIKVKK